MPSLGEAKEVFQPQGSTLPALVRELRDLTAARKAAEAEAERCSSAIHAIATKFIPPLMENLELDEFNVPDIGRVELRQEVYAHVNKEHTATFHQWLKDNGHADLVVPYVFPATLKAFASEQLGQGVALPDFMGSAFVPTAKLLAPRKSKK